MKISKRFRGDIVNLKPFRAPPEHGDGSISYWLPTVLIKIKATQRN